MVEFKKELEIDEKINKLSLVTRTLSLIRLALAINLVIWVIVAFSYLSFYIYIAIISFVVLLLFLFFSNKTYASLAFYKKKKDAYVSHKRRRELKLNYFNDNGKDFLNKDDYKLADLDIFGKGSLFQYLNVTKTKPGRELLANSLKNNVKNPSEYSDAIISMSNENIIDIEASLLEFKDNAKNVNYEEYTSVLGKKIDFKLMFLLPLFSLIATIAYFIISLVNHYNLLPNLFLVIATIALSKIFLDNEVFRLDASKYYNLSNAYYKLSETIVNTNFDNPYYKNLQSIINSKLGDLKRFKTIYSWLLTRKNIVVNLILNIFAYDFFMILIYNSFIKKTVDLEDLFKAIAEVEVLTSFSTISVDNEIYCKPLKSNKISAKNMYHPLVKNCIKNDFTISGGVVLTGSNMSGKTTFMRTLGINQILANANALCFALSFETDEYNIYTSLRANDMLQEGISTFYAEILRMKKANEAIKKEKCLILIDEIFKGTNAYERISASFKVIDKFNEYKALFIISTHDFELCDAKNITNYHFNEEYDNDNKISFDYKIKEGKCVSKNALYLLKMANIIED